MTKQKTHLLLISLFGVVMLGIGSWFGYSLLVGGPLKGDLSHDFGVVPIDRPFSVLEHTFVLKNQTNHTLQLADAVPTCGCTTTTWPKDPVPSGDSLIIPVHLKLRRSQVRKSAIRLEFATGEVVVLHIEGIGRFKQPLSAKPYDFVLKMKDEEGTRGVLKLEWYEKDRPPMPVVKAPSGVRVELEEWRFAIAANPHKGTPGEWTLLMHLFLEYDIEGEPVIGLTVADAPTLHIPFEIEAQGE